MTFIVELYGANFHVPLESEALNSSTIALRHTLDLFASVKHDGTRIAVA